MKHTLLTAIWAVLSYAGVAQSSTVELPSGCGSSTATYTVHLVQPVTCAGDSNGIVALQAVGSAGYTVNWSTGDTTDTVSGLGPGTYGIGVYDEAAECWAFDSITLLAPSPMAVFTDSLKSVNCLGGNDGVLIVSDTASLDSFEYAWSNGSINTYLYSLSAGTYTLTVSNQSGCHDTLEYVISEPASAVEIDSINLTPAYCHGGEVGSIAIQPAGGTPPYTYAWNSGHTTASVNELGAGNYVVTVSDNNGCTVDSTVTVTEPAAPDTADISTTAASCFLSNDGTASASFIGGTGPYAYTWSNGGMGSTITGLATGPYAVTATDAVGCTQVAVDTVLAPDSIGLEILLLDTITCHGEADGALVGTASGGTGAFSFLWSDGSTTDTLTSLSAGWHALTVTDSSGCSRSDSVFVGQPEPLGLDSVAWLSPSCFDASDGALTVAVGGGTPGYQLLWTTGDSTSSISGLTAGTYGLTVTDASACMHDTTLLLTAPDSLYATLLSMDTATCEHGSDDGAIHVGANGGVGPYAYSWSTGDSVALITQLPVGHYAVTITDSNGCTTTSAFALAFAHANPDAALPDSLLVCDQDSASLEAIAGMETYAWNTGDTSSAITIQSSGSYHVSITSENGCASIDSTYATFAASTPFTLGDDTVICLEFADSFQISPDTFGSVYAWSTGASTSSITVAQSGSYSLAMTNQAGCTFWDTLSVTIDSCTPEGSALVPYATGLTVYPNPATEYAVVHWAISPSEAVTYRLLSLNGALVREWKSPAGTARIDLTSIEPGLYVLQARSGIGSVRTKLIKH